MDIIEKQFIKRFSIRVIIFGIIYFILYSAVALVSLSLGTDLPYLVRVLIMLSILFSILIMIILMVHYCVKSIYKVEFKDEKIIFTSVLKKYTFNKYESYGTLDMDVGRYKLTIGKNDVGLYFYRFLSVKKSLFKQDDMELITAYFITK